MGLKAAMKSLEGPEDLVGHLAYTKTLDLGSWVYEDLWLFLFCLFG